MNLLRGSTVSREEDLGIAEEKVPDLKILWQL